MANTIDPTKVDVFKFMNLRSPQAISHRSKVYDYINDDFIAPATGNTDAPPPVITPSSNTTLPFWERLRVPRSLEVSPVGKVVVENIFKMGGRNKREVNKVIITKVKELLPEFELTDINVLLKSIPSFFEKAPYILSDNGRAIYLLPGAHNITRFDKKFQPVYSLYSSELRAVPVILSEFLVQIAKDQEALKEVATSNVPAFSDRKEKLLKDIKAAIGLGPNSGFLLTRLMSEEFQKMKMECFDNLYKLYVLRNEAAVSFEYEINQLRVIHVLEFLALDEYIIYAKSQNANWANGFIKYFIGTTNIVDPLLGFLNEINADSARQGKKIFIEDYTDILALCNALPVIHPIFVRRAYYLNPFNSLQPIGIGDLKVVKQWLLGYKKGEISHIHNVLARETNIKTFRNLEKTSETFTLNTEQSSENQQENSTADKFEVKREVESTIKNDLNLNVGASFTYNSAPVTANLTGNVASNNSQQSVQKTANNFARDIMDKAVSKVQSKSTVQRSSSKQFENEESYTHTIDNTTLNAKHISGIYRWVDKKYRAQLYNYGKRLMYEFLVPEPGAFYILSKLKDYESTLMLPENPGTRQAGSFKFTLKPADITESEYAKLKAQYGLTETYPDTGPRTVVLQNKGESNFSKSNVGGHWQEVTTPFFSQLADTAGYAISKVIVIGDSEYHWHTRGDDVAVNNRNSLRLVYNSETIFEWKGDIYTMPPLDNTRQKATHSLPYYINPAKPLMSDLFSFDVISKDATSFNFTVSLELTRSANDLYQWQTIICNKIESIERGKFNSAQALSDEEFASKVAEYNTAIRKIKAQIVNDIIQGRSSKYNRDIIERELKKHALSLITKEFDLDVTDNILGSLDAMSSREIEIVQQKFTAEPTPHFSNDAKKKVKYPVIDLPTNSLKAKHIQFLEQAFEWGQMSYVFYPYFWASEHKWVDLMNHIDNADPNMSAFLQAGSAKLLVAVSPSYDKAVMHYLATGEPWAGGTPPVIGDPLYVPIYEEIKKSQDDLQGATPEGPTWDFEVPTSLTYLEGSEDKLPEDF